MRQQVGALRVDAVNDQPIKAKIGCNRKPIVRRRNNRVRMRRFLAIRPRSKSALVLDELRVFAKPAIRCDGIHRHIAAQIICHIHPAVCGVQTDIARSGAICWLLVDFA
ncbi:hypothetical protein D3C86_1854370 [compost metagenome]